MPVISASFDCSFLNVSAQYYDFYPDFVPDFLTVHSFEQKFFETFKGILKTVTGFFLFSAYDL